MKDKTDKTVLVIGGGVAGMEAALQIGYSGYKVILVEKENSIGGTLNSLYSSFPRWDDPSKLVQMKSDELQKCGNVQIKTGTTPVSSTKQEKGFAIELKGTDGTNEIVKADAVVIATGFGMFDASAYGEYGYGVFNNVLNTLEFESKLKEWSEDKSGTIEKPKTVAFIKCVGSRDRSKGYPYCSKICCMITAKQAGLVKDILPDAKCFVFYMDYRASGKEYEEFVRTVIEEKHVRYVRGRPAKIIPENGRMTLRVEDTLMGVPVEVRADMVVLAAALEPSAGTKQMAELFKLETDQYGFVEPAYGKSARTSDRVFVAGGCTYAVETKGALQQGASAAAEVLAMFGSENTGE
jgi:heterodisulfide reductase subunit A